MKRKLIKIKVSKKAEKEVEEMNLGSFTQVIKMSLTLLKYLREETKAGNEIILRDKITGKEKEVVFLE